MYEQWLNQSLAKFNAKYGTTYGKRKYHTQTDDKDCTCKTLVEFSERGDAYVHGIGGTCHIKNAVDPFVG